MRRDQVYLGYAMARKLRLKIKSQAKFTLGLVTGTALSVPKQALSLLRQRPFPKQVWVMRLASALNFCIFAVL
ncbi:MAG: hypothetical protein J1F29_03715 [Lentimicrobiaceae bacterium]|nr:hypothetical protein [Lentimicrobiaceae bacterium]